jgi:hypothetical protein
MKILIFIKISRKSRTSEGFIHIIFLHNFSKTGKKPKIWSNGPFSYVNKPTLFTVLVSVLCMMELLDTISALDFLPQSVIGTT